LQALRALSLAGCIVQFLQTSVDPVAAWSGGDVLVHFLSPCELALALDSSGAQTHTVATAQDPCPHQRPELQPRAFRAARDALCGTYPTGRSCCHAYRAPETAAGRPDADIAVLLASNQRTPTGGIDQSENSSCFRGRAQPKGREQRRGLADSNATKSSLEREVKQDHWTLFESRYAFRPSPTQTVLSRLQALSLAHRCQALNSGLSLGNRSTQTLVRFCPYDNRICWGRCHG
jgi:hypothetical protein